MDDKFEKVIIIGIICLFGWYILSRLDGNFKKTNELENKIIELEEENKALLEDKLYYKERYINLANEINDWFNEHNINQYILTDTDR